MLFGSAALFFYQDEQKEERLKKLNSESKTRAGLPFTATYEEALNK